MAAPDEPFDPLRTPPSAAATAGTGPNGPVALPPLDEKAEKVRRSATELLGEPVLTVLVGRGLPPRKWPPVLAIVVAVLGALIAPFGGFGPLLFWSLAGVTAWAWRQHQEGRIPRRAERPAGALVVTPSQIALLGVDRGWFESRMVADEVIATAPLAPLELHNRAGYGHVEVDGRRLHLDRGRRRRLVERCNAVIEAAAEGGFHRPLPMTTRQAPAPAPPVAPHAPSTARAADGLPPLP